MNREFLTALPIELLSNIGEMGFEPIHVRLAFDEPLILTASNLNVLERKIK